MRTVSDKERESTIKEEVDDGWMQVRLRVASGCKQQSKRVRGFNDGVAHACREAKEDRQASVVVITTCHYSEDRGQGIRSASPGHRRPQTTIQGWSLLDDRQQSAGGFARRARAPTRRIRRARPSPLCLMHDAQRGAGGSGAEWTRMVARKAVLLFILPLPPVIVA